MYAVQGTGVPIAGIMMVHSNGVSPLDIETVDPSKSRWGSMQAAPHQRARVGGVPTLLEPTLLGVPILLGCQH